MPSFQGLTSIEVALTLAADLVEDSPGISAGILVEFPAEQRGLALPLEGPAPDDAIVHFAQLVAETLGHEPGGRVVLVSVRGSAPYVTSTSIELREADLETWRELQAVFSPTQLDLLDWFIFMGTTQAISLSELAGPRPAW